MITFPLHLLPLKRLDGRLQRCKRFLEPALLCVEEGQLVAHEPARWRTGVKSVAPCDHLSVFAQCAQLFLEERPPLLSRHHVEKEKPNFICM